MINLALGFGASKNVFRLRLLRFNHRDIGDGDEFQLASTLVEHQRPTVFGHQAMFGLLNLNDIAIIEPQRVRLERSTVFDIQQGLSRHASILRQDAGSVKASAAILIRPT